MTHEPLTILLAEDNEDDIVLMRETLAGSRFFEFVFIARDGDEALAYLRNEDRFADARLPSLVMLDINMPKKNGLEVLEDIKHDARLCRLPVVMLTVSNREEDIVRAYSAGACTFIRKPVQIEDFRAIIAQMSRYWSEIASVPHSLPDVGEESSNTRPTHTMTGGDSPT
jgi:CheY-like chemotaxis protein